MQQTGSAAGAQPELDPKSLDAIRNLMETEASAPAPANDARIVLRPNMRNFDAEPSPQKQPKRRAQQDAATSPAQAARKHGFDEVRPQQSGGDGILGKAKARVLGYRPTRKHIILGAFALLILFRPGLVIGVTLLSVFGVITAFLLMGEDDFWRRVVGLGRWYARRRPQRAAALHRKLDAFALKWDAFLDRFPEGTVDSLYLPDLAEIGKAEDAHDQTMDRRLAGLRQGDAGAQ